MLQLNFKKATADGSIAPTRFRRRSGLPSLKLQQNRDDSVHASLMICKGNKVQHCRSFSLVLHLHLKAADIKCYILYAFNVDGLIEQMIRATQSVVSVYSVQNTHEKCTLFSMPFLRTRQLYFRLSVKLSNTAEGLCSCCSVIQEVRIN